MAKKLVCNFTHGKAAILSILTLLLFASCRDVVNYFNLTRTKPEPSNLVGVWVPDKATLDDMRDRGGYDTTLQTKLVLENNGSASVINMPDWWNNGFGTSYKSVQSEQGKWRVYQRSGAEYWQVSLALPSGTKFINLLGQKSPYEMLIYIGDPDSDHVMMFTRSN